MGFLKSVGKAVVSKMRSQSFIIMLICIFSTVLSIFASVVTIMTFFSVSRWSNLYVNRSEISDEINRVSIRTYEASMQLRSYCSTSSEEALNTYLSVMETLNTNGVKSEIGDLDDISSLSSALDSYVSEVDSILTSCRTAYDLMIEADYPGAARNVLFADSFTNSLLVMSDRGYALMEAVDSYLTPMLDSERFMLELFVNITAVSLVLVSAVQILLMIYTNKAILKPVKLIKDELINFSKGNYSSQFTIKEDDSEIGQLSGAINASKKLLHKMTEELTWLLDQISQGNVSFYINLEYVGEFIAIKNALNTILDENNNEFRKIRGSSDSISIAADEMSQSSIKVAQGGQEQTESIAHLSNSISGITEKITANAANAQTASTYSKRAADSLDKGSKEMEFMLEAMHEIEETSHEINKIIRTIEDIAFETNILAINAAVEAASAGDAGKGFGVVSEQVRLLAGKSAEAAQDTTNLIEASIAAVNKGARYAAETAAVMKDIVEDSQRSNEVISEIAIAASEEEAAVREISTQVQRIESVIRTNNAVAEQSAAAAEELAGQASMMRQLIERYQLRED